VSAAGSRTEAKLKALGDLLSKRAVAVFLGGATSTLRDAENSSLAPCQCCEQKRQSSRASSFNRTVDPGVNRPDPCSLTSDRGPLSVVAALVAALA